MRQSQPVRWDRRLLGSCKCEKQAASPELVELHRYSMYNELGLFGTCERIPVVFPTGIPIWVTNYPSWSESSD